MSSLEESKKEEISLLMKTIKLSQEHQDAVREEYNKESFTTTSSKVLEVARNLEVAAYHVREFVKILRKEDYGKPNQEKGNRIHISLACRWVKEKLREEFNKDNYCRKNKRAITIGKVCGVTTDSVYRWFAQERKREQKRKRNQDRNKKREAARRSARLNLPKPAKAAVKADSSSDKEDIEDMEESSDREDGSGTAPTTPPKSPLAKRRAPNSSSIHDDEDYSTDDDENEEALQVPTPGTSVGTSGRRARDPSPLAKRRSSNASNTNYDRHDSIDDVTVPPRIDEDDEDMELNQGEHGDEGEIDNGRQNGEDYEDMEMEGNRNEENYETDHVPIHEPRRSPASEEDNRMEPEFEMPIDRQSPVFCYPHLDKPERRFDSQTFDKGLLACKKLLECDVKGDLTIKFRPLLEEIKQGSMHGIGHLIGIVDSGLSEESVELLKELIVQLDVDETIESILKRIREEEIEEYWRKHAAAMGPQSIIQEPATWMTPCEESLLGCFFYHRSSKLDQYLQKKKTEGRFARIDGYNEQEDLEIHNFRLAKGLLCQYQKEELAEMFRQKSQQQDLMQLTRRRQNVPYPPILLLTDWRLAHLNSKVLLNVDIQYLPTSINGMDFFSSITNYVLQCEENFNYRTIIFAFGGSRLFSLQSFSGFWREMISLAKRKNVQLHWLAQDWLDNVMSDQDAQKKLKEFNKRCKNIVEKRKARCDTNVHKFCNIRDMFRRPVVAYEQGSVDTAMLQQLYTDYITYFVNECGVKAYVELSTVPTGRVAEDPDVIVL